MTFRDLRVEVNLVKNTSSKIVAMASVIVDNTLRVNGFRVINGEKGPFVAAPSHKGTGKDDKGNTVEKWYDDVLFVDSKTDPKDYRTPAQEETYKLIIAEYERQRGSTGNSTRGSSASAQNSQRPSGDSKSRPATPQNDQGYDW